MQLIFISFVAFIGLGLFFQKYDRRTRLLILLVAAAMVIYATLK
jgi:hypothetical protein